jgi:uncharacterized protein (TIGR03083 family)
MARTLADARRWVDEGTRLINEALAGLDEESYRQVTLPGWTRKNLVAHLAANAEAVGNLVHWAATGEVTPMYSSMEQRNADIEAGGHRDSAELTDAFRSTAERLAAGMAALTDEQWSVDVVTAQGRTVPASETPWMRAREVMVHAVDLGTGIGFADLPADFLSALCVDIVGKRNAGDGPALIVVAADTGESWTIGTGDGPVTVTGPLADVTAYLAGRAYDEVTAADGSAAPSLPAWL